jgi:hypothetical protein
MLTTLAQPGSRLIIRRTRRLSSVPPCRVERDFDYGEEPADKHCSRLTDVLTAYLMMGIANA